MLQWMLLGRLLLILSQVLFMTARLYELSTLVLLLTLCQVQMGWFIFLRLHRNVLLK